MSANIFNGDPYVRNAAVRASRERYPDHDWSRKGDDVAQNALDERVRLIGYERLLRLSMDDLVDLSVETGTSNWQVFQKLRAYLERGPRQD